MIRRYVSAAPRKPRHAPPSLRAAPAQLTPRFADAMIGLIDHLAVARADAEEAAARRAHAWSPESMITPIPVRRPMPVLVAPALATGDRRPVAAGRDPCARCETRGDLGCAHQQPFVAQEPRA